MLTIYTIISLIIGCLAALFADIEDTKNRLLGIPIGAWLTGVVDCLFWPVIALMGLHIIVKIMFNRF